MDGVMEGSIIGGFCKCKGSPLNKDVFDNVRILEFNVNG